MEQKYYNDAIIGNGKMTVSFSKKGELLRLFHTSPDYKQFFESFVTGVKINDSALIYLHDDVNNEYEQYYLDGTNILVTDIFNTYFGLEIKQIDFVMVKENILVRKYRFINNNNIDLDIKFLVSSKVFSNINNDTCGYVKNDALLQYNHDFTVCTFSKEKLYSSQVNDVSSNFRSGVIGGKDYIGMSRESAISYDVNILRPGEEKELSIYVYINDNGAKCLLNDLDNEIERIRKISVDRELEDTKKYWKKYLKEHKKINIEENEKNEAINKIYDRTILYMPLLVNCETGGISAGIEVDETRSKCGRYSYCWLRDAVYISEALDILNMQDANDKFYKKFCKMTQSRNGMWEQRFFTDGRLAPCWGYQVDETASVVFGVYRHYLVTKDKKFLKDTLKMCENAIKFLEKYVDDVLNEKNKMHVSYDLWEEHEGISLYSMSAIFGAYSAMIEINSIVKDLFTSNRLKLEQIAKETEMLNKRVRELKEFISKKFYNENMKTYTRNLEEERLDISILGAITTFKVFTPKEKKVLNTIEKMNMTLRTYTGGYVRYENDNYMNGYNPWPIANLWMANYYLDAGENKKAVECFDFVVKSASGHGFLGEQINNETMKPMWVIGLTWSHAMFVNTLKRLSDLKLI